MKEIAIKYLNGKYPINTFIEQYVNYRGGSTKNLYTQYIYRGRPLIPIQHIADHYMQYIMEWVINKFNINLITKDNKLLRYV